MPRGLILFGHGARDPSWRVPLDALATAAASLDATCAIEVAFLEFQPPTLLDAIDALAARGVFDITVAPIFWARGGHVDHDLPPLLSSAKARHTQLRAQVLPVLSDLPGMIDFIASRITRIGSVSG
jgi:sirohydrochlorin cobaltochelatase